MKFLFPLSILLLAPVIAFAGAPAIPPSAPISINLTKTLAAQAVTYDAYGDSITAGYAASVVANNYVSLLGSALSVTPVNHGVSGSEIGDQESTIYAATPNDTGSQLYTYMIGTNDGTFWGANSGQVQTWHTVYQAELAWLAMPSRAKTLGQNTALIAYAGSGGSHWATSATFGGSFSEQTQTLSDTATFSVWGRCAYVAYGIDSATTGGTFTITVDGTSYGTFFSQGAGQTGTIPARLGATHGSAMARICGLSLTAHNVVVTITSATSASNVVWLDWVGQPTGSQFVTGPTVLAASPIRSTNAPGDLNIQPYSAFIQQDVSALTADGLNVGYVETAGYIVSPTDFYYITLNNAAISGTSLTFTSPIGVPVAVGQQVSGPGVTAGTTISSGSGLSWVVNNSQTVPTTTLFLGDGTHPSDAGETHIRDAFVAAINTQFSAKGRSSASAQVSPLLSVLWGCNPSLINTPVQGNVIFGGGYTSPGVCSSNKMTGSGLNNAIIAGKGNTIGGGGPANTNNDVIVGSSGSTIQFGGNNCIIGGALNLVQGFNNCAIAGQNNSITGTNSATLGGQYGNDRGRISVVVQGSGAFSASGKNQTVWGTLGATGSSTTVICVTADGAAAGAANTMNLAANTSGSIVITAHARDITTIANNYTALWNGAHTLAVGASYPSSITLDGATTAVSPDFTRTAGAVTGALFSATPDTTNGGTKVCFTPPTANTDTWHIGASIMQIEVQ